MTALRNLTAQIFDRLTVGDRGPNTRFGTAQWWCTCLCGNRVLVQSQSLLRHATKSCGCLNSEQTADRNRTHGLSHTPEYRIWSGMITRCYNPRARAYSDYGGRGIYVAEEWRHSFLVFLAEMGQRPTKSHTIERKDNNGPYSKDNCCWTTMVQQNRNKRSNRLVTLHGETACINEWLERQRLRQETFRKRLDRGWSIETALLTPVLTRKHKINSPQLVLAMS